MTLEIKHKIEFYPREIEALIRMIEGDIRDLASKSQGYMTSAAADVIAARVTLIKLFRKHQKNCIEHARFGKKMKEKFAIFMTELEILWLYDYTGTGNESNDFTDLMVNRLGKYLVS